MRKLAWLLGCVVGLVVPLAQAAERKFDFSTNQPGKAPAGWRSLVAGDGSLGIWEVAMEDMAPVLEPLTPKALSIAKKGVVVQKSTDRTDEHFPILLYDEEIFNEAVFKVKIQIRDGTAEQIAGVVFRAQDEKNFYVVRLSALGRNIRFYKFLNGERSAPIGPDVPIRKGVWHELEVKTAGNRIEIRLDGKEAMPALTDLSFSKGRIGFITKSDTVAAFSDLEISYRPVESLAQIMVREIMREYPRLQGVRVIGRSLSDPTMRVLAASRPADLTAKPSPTDVDVIRSNRAYVGREPSTMMVTLPVHDRNGDAIAAIKFLMEPFKGQTDASAVGRVRPAILMIEKRIGAEPFLAE